MDRNIFFTLIGSSLFGGGLTSGRQRGLAVKLDAFGKQGVGDARWQAYMLATSYHETGGAMLPVKEWGQGKGHPYGGKRKRDGSAYDHPDCLYYGRGDVQLTWYENYEQMGRVLDAPLLEQPDLALEPSLSARIMIEGMTRGLSLKGDFTGRALEDYFNSRRSDPYNARRVVNGLDCAEKIAEVYRKFLRALRLAMMTVALLLVAGCRSARTVTARTLAHTDSTAVTVAVDSSRRQAAWTVAAGQSVRQWQVEDIRFSGTWQRRETEYDTARPEDSATGRSPVLREVLTTFSGDYGGMETKTSERDGETVVTGEENVRSVQRSVQVAAVERQQQETVERETATGTIGSGAGRWVAVGGAGAAALAAMLLLHRHFGPYFRHKGLHEDPPSDADD